MRQAIGKSFTLRLPDEVIAKIRTIAQERADRTNKNVSLADVARELVTRGLKEVERRR